jgi:hypothetical protein
MPYFWCKLVSVQLFDVGWDFLLGGFPLVRLVETQATMRQIASGASALISGCANLATGVVQLSKERSFGIVQDVDGGRVLCHARFDRGEWLLRKERSS